jgi:hypothetical protein
MPVKDEDGFYTCSISGHNGRQCNSDIKNIMSQIWSNHIQLCPGQTEYARVFVGYDNLDDNTEYTIYIKTVRLERSDHTLAVLAEYGKKKSAKASSTDTSSQDASSDEE